MKSNDEKIEKRLERLGNNLDSMNKQGMYGGHKYEKKSVFVRIPLVHVAHDFDPETGKQRVAKGFLSIGGMAVGLHTLGGNVQTREFADWVRNNFMNKGVR